MASCRHCGKANPFSSFHDGSREAWQWDHSALAHPDHEHNWTREVPQSLIDDGLYLWVNDTHDLFFCTECLRGASIRDLRDNGIYLEV